MRGKRRFLHWIPQMRSFPEREVFGFKTVGKVQEWIKAMIIAQNTDTMHGNRRLIPKNQAMESREFTGLH